jgi:endonuclease YncB( thermonuclease family)
MKQILPLLAVSAIALCASTFGAQAQTRLVVTKVVDGHTIVVNGKQRVTLVGVGEPPTGAVTVKDQQNRLEKLLIGRVVTIVPDSIMVPTKVTGITGYVYLSDTLVNALIIERGNSLAVRAQNYQMRDRFLALEESAHLRRAGAWVIAGVDMNAVEMTITPNPVNEATMLNFRLPQACNVTLEIIDPKGNNVGRLVDEKQGAGSHVAVFQRLTLPNGNYTVRLKAGATTIVKIMQVIDRPD